MKDPQLTKYKKQAKELIKLMGFGVLQSYNTLYGTVLTTYGKKGASMWFVSFSINDNWDIVAYEINSTYFKLDEIKKKAVTDKIKSYICPTTQ